MELVHSSNGTTQRGADYGRMQDSKPKRMKSSKKGEQKTAHVVPSHFMQTDVTNVKGETLIFSNMMFCILWWVSLYYQLHISPTQTKCFLNPFPGLPPSIFLLLTFTWIKILANIGGNILFAGHYNEGDFLF